MRPPGCTQVQTAARSTAPRSKGQPGRQRQRTCRRSPSCAGRRARRTRWGSLAGWGPTGRSTPAPGPGGQQRAAEPGRRARALSRAHAVRPAGRAAGADAAGRQAAQSLCTRLGGGPDTWPGRRRRGAPALWTAPSAWRWARSPAPHTWWCGPRTPAPQRAPARGRRQQGQRARRSARKHPAPVLASGTVCSAGLARAAAMCPCPRLPPRHPPSAAPPRWPPAPPPAAPAPRAPRRRPPQPAASRPPARLRGQAGEQRGGAWPHVLARQAGRQQHGQRQQQRTAPGRAGAP